MTDSRKLMCIFQCTLPQKPFDGSKFKRNATGNNIIIQPLLYHFAIASRRSNDAWGVDNVEEQLVGIQHCCLLIAHINYSQASCCLLLACGT